MKQRFTKSLHIVNCLLSFCHYAGAVDYKVDLKPEPGHTAIEIRASIPDMDVRLLTELDVALKIKRTHEVEQNYWELSGEADSQEELTLIGMMTDDAAVSYVSGILTIRVVRMEE